MPRCHCPPLNFPTGPPTSALGGLLSGSWGPPEANAKKASLWARSPPLSPFTHGLYGHLRGPVALQVSTPVNSVGDPGEAGHGVDRDLGGLQGDLCSLLPAGWPDPLPRPLGQLPPAVSGTPVAKRVPCKPKGRILLPPVWLCLAVLPFGPCPKPSPQSLPMTLSQPLGTRDRWGGPQAACRGQSQAGTKPTQAGEGRRGDSWSGQAGSGACPLSSDPDGGTRGAAEGGTGRQWTWPAGAAP